MTTFWVDDNKPCPNHTFHACRTPDDFYWCLDLMEKEETFTVHLDWHFGGGHEDGNAVLAYLINRIKEDRHKVHIHFISSDPWMNKSMMIDAKQADCFESIQGRPQRIYKQP